MSVLKLRIVPDPVLRQTAAPVGAVDAAIGRLMDDMIETMYAAKGIGLAAPQIGQLRRVIVMDVAEEQSARTAIAMADPEIIWRSQDTYTHREGCLSIPQQYAEVTRPRTVRVKYRDQSSKMQEREVSDLASSCVQHEIDHLNGVLFVDYLSALRRDMLLRKLDKAVKRGDVDVL